MRIVVVSQLGHPLATVWIEGFTRLGNEVVTITNNDGPISGEQLGHWGFITEPVIFNLGSDRLHANLAHSVIQSLGGYPDIIFGWWGSGILPQLRKVKELFPDAKSVLCVDTFPNASRLRSEFRELIALNWASRWLDGYMYYSTTMQRHFQKRVPRSNLRPSIAIVEPFPQSSYAKMAKPETRMALQRVNDRPHVIFTGRSDLMWSTRIQDSKDAVGMQLAWLSSQGINVFVNEKANIDRHPNMYLYRDVSNIELLNGVFTDYISQFDAHLVLYNVTNATIARRVACGLSTRFALALAAESTILVPSTSSFVGEMWSDTSPCVQFDTIDDIPSIVRNQSILDVRRQRLSCIGINYSLEAQWPSIKLWLHSVMSS